MTRPITLRDDLAARLATLAAAQGESLEVFIEGQLETWLVHEETARMRQPSLTEKLEALLHAAEDVRRSLPGSASGCACSRATCTPHVNAWYRLIEVENALKRAISEIEHVRLQKWELRWLGWCELDAYSEFCEVVASDTGVRTYDLQQGKKVHERLGEPQVTRGVFWNLFLESWDVLGVVEQAGETHYIFRRDRRSNALAEMLANYEP